MDKYASKGTVIFDKTAFVKFKIVVMTLILFFVISITAHNPMFIEEHCIVKSGLLGKLKDFISYLLDP